MDTGPPDRRPAEPSRREPAGSPPARFPVGLVEQLSRAEEIVLATGPGHRRRTPTPVVVVDLDVYVRVVAEPPERLDAELAAHPLVQIHVHGSAVAARAVRETDASALAAVDDAYREKYGPRWPEPHPAFLAPGAVARTWRLDVAPA